MHLDNRSFAWLVSPFVAAGTLWFVSDFLIAPIERFVEPIQKSATMLIEEKGESYRFLTHHKEQYETMIEQMRIRQENLFWISDRLYVPYAALLSPPLPLSPLLQPPPLLPPLGEPLSLDEKVTKEPTLQMILPQQQVAIINHKIHHVGERIDGVKLLQVTNDSVHIHTSKGSQWVKMFH
jgi:hypothetical protein